MQKTIEQRLLARTTENEKVTSPHVDTPCWICSYSTVNGYPLMNVRGKLMLAHRVAYELWVDSIQENKCVCHSCDERRCVNPEHQWLGTHVDNMADMYKKGRQNPATGDRNGLRTHPESRSWGDRNGSRLHPESRPWGDRNGSRTHPEKVPRGIEHGNAKLTEAQVREIRAYRNQGCRLVDVVNFMKLPFGTIEHVFYYHTWKHIK